MLLCIGIYGLWYMELIRAESTERFEVQVSEGDAGWL